MTNYTKLIVFGNMSHIQGNVYHAGENHINMFFKKPLKQSGLEYILISESLSNVVEYFLIKPGYRSDHSTVILELKFNSFERGFGSLIIAY